MRDASAVVMLRPALIPEPLCLQAAIAQAAAALVDTHLHPLLNYARWVEVRSTAPCPCLLATCALCWALQAKFGEMTRRSTMHWLFAEPTHQ